MNYVDSPFKGIGALFEKKHKIQISLNFFIGESQTPNSQTIGW